ncbi:aromatic alcohol reductase [Sphingomonadaceae bacterium jetA1]|uniref:aromatic alcohol reductase n=1 Tax=Facivitalis istanbulensis TaxID=3075838 RepID=UPI0034901834
MMDIDVKRTGILVLGAGELGMAVLNELAPADARRRAGSVSVLLRPQTTAVVSAARHAVRALGIDIIDADLATSSVEELIAIFSRFSMVICCTGFVGGPGTQQRITEAVLGAGVDHYIPWQFGVDYDVVGRGSGQAVWDDQLDVRTLLRSQDRVRWTIISTGIFTSFVFLPEFGVVDLRSGTVRALGHWDHRLTATTPEDIGQVTALVASDPITFANQILHVAGDTFTYRDLADTVDGVLGITVERLLSTPEQLRADTERDPTDLMAAYRLAFARPDGVAWPIEDSFNAKLGLATVDIATWLRRSRETMRVGGPKR